MMKAIMLKKQLPVVDATSVWRVKIGKTTKGTSITI